MKKVLLLAVIAIFTFADTYAQGLEYKVVTVVESVVPMGLGR